MFVMLSASICNICTQHQETGTLQLLKSAFLYAVSLYRCVCLPVLYNTRSQVFPWIILFIGPEKCIIIPPKGRGSKETIPSVKNILLIFKNRFTLTQG
jgi:hypothetical protein